MFYRTPEGGLTDLSLGPESSGTARGCRWGVVAGPRVSEGVSERDLFLRNFGRFWISLGVRTEDMTTSLPLPPHTRVEYFLK
jgi:hypothetical protein